MAICRAFSPSRLLLVRFFTSSVRIVTDDTVLCREAGVACQHLHDDAVSGISMCSYLSTSVFLSERGA